MASVIDVLYERGLVEAITDEALRTLVKEQKLKLYCGFDPTSDGLHLGNMVTLMVLAWFQRHGHAPVAVVGGATGMIGDPSGKSTERVLLDEKAIQENSLGIAEDVKRCLQDAQGQLACTMENNIDWYRHYHFIDFLRDIGKYFRVGVMLSKESVRARLQTEEGLSFTEFSYQLLQAYDFYHLYTTQGVSLQIGGSDQWGNITAGIELIRKLRGETAYGMTCPLLVKSDGQKFGKSEQGTVWLSPKKLPSYDLYQYLYRVSDADVIRLLKMLTFVDMKVIVRMERAMSQPEYVPNSAQKLLAESLTEMLHGQEGLQKALRVTESASPGKVTELTAQNLRSLIGDLPLFRSHMNEIIGRNLADIIVTAGFMPSKGEVVRLINNGGLYLNEVVVTTKDRSIKVEDFIEGEFVLFSFGKKRKALLQIT